VRPPLFFLLVVVSILLSSRIAFLLLQNDSTHGKLLALTEGLSLTGPRAASSIQAGHLARNAKNYFAVFVIYCSPRCKGKQWKRTCIAQVAGTKELVALT
jgi:hypothetical protein